jgi:hypothetical protein
MDMYAAGRMQDPETNAGKIVRAPGEEGSKEAPKEKI